MVNHIKLKVSLPYILEIVNEGESFRKSTECVTLTPSYRICYLDPLTGGDPRLSSGKDPW